MNQKTLNAMSQERDMVGFRLLNQLKAFKSGKKVMLTVANPNKKETNKPFIKVPAAGVFKHTGGYFQ